MCRRRTMDGQALRCRRDGFIWWGGKECVVDFLLDSLCPKSQITHYFARTKARCNHSPFRSRRDPSGNSVNRIPSLHMSKNAVYLLFWPYLLICHITVNHSTWLTNTCSERVFVFTSYGRRETYCDWLRELGVREGRGRRGCIPRLYAMAWYSVVVVVIVVAAAAAAAVAAAVAGAGAMLLL
uniref:Bm9881 n=1 Tax=Brugia malayi TaxID=6279 RepID=A0A1I9G2B1_BRUMA|nr:Bm9881 [Brugia malayi]